jgi:glycosyltransferase involved in cell wall biosynthesis
VKNNNIGTYNVIVTCRNSEQNIKSALTSLINQSITPKYIIVVDDGSKDNTPNILKDIQSDNNNLYIITNPDMGYNIGRVVQNWNKALRFAKELNLEMTDYHMIATDDTQYEQDYCEKIIRYMDSDISLAIASGNFDNNHYVTPHGAGRLVRNSFFCNNHGYYPEKMGYESIVLHTANQMGFTYKVIPEAKFLHTRELGSTHNFYEFGASMRTLGYHPLFALGRILIYFVSGKPIGRLGSLSMLYYYLSYRPRKEGYDSMFDETTRRSIRNDQAKRIRSFRAKRIRRFIGLSKS